MIKKIIVTTILMVASHPIFAQLATEKSDKTTFNISGFVDGYYRFDAAKNAANNRTSFTNSHNSFELGMASLKFEGTKGKFGFLADLGIGKRANEFDYNDVGIARGIKQLYATYTPTEWIKFTVGSWATHVGYELVDPAANKNYSMSYMFSWGPFSHTGVKADITAGKHAFMIGVSNPTDFRTTPVNSKKFILAQYALSATDDVKFYLNYVGGTGLDSVKKNQIDLVATAKLSSVFNLGYNATYQSAKSVNSAAVKSNEPTKGWWGSAIYINMALTETTGITLRSELFNDKDQLTALSNAPKGASIFAHTLSTNIKRRSFMIIPEFRYESSKQNVFYTKNGNNTSSAASVLLAAIYSF